MKTNSRMEAGPCTVEMKLAKPEGLNSERLWMPTTTTTSSKAISHNGRRTKFSMNKMDYISQAVAHAFHLSTPEMEAEAGRQRPAWSTTLSQNKNNNKRLKQCMTTRKSALQKISKEEKSKLIYKATRRINHTRVIFKTRQRREHQTLQKQQNSRSRETLSQNKHLPTGDWETDSSAARV